jgi:hypothetical protein
VADGDGREFFLGLLFFLEESIKFVQSKARIGCGHWFLFLVISELIFSQTEGSFCFDGMYT